MVRTGSSGSGRASGLPLPLLGLVFLLSRLAILPLPSPATDVGIYARYAREQSAAARTGTSFYEFHAREVERQAEQAGGASIDEYKDVEYPPLAVAFMRLPALWAGEQPEDSAPGDAFTMRYYWAFRALMAIVDVALFILLVVLVRRLLPVAAEGDSGPRLLLYTASTLVLCHLLYDRLDLLQTALVMAALALLTSRWHYGWSFAVLAAAVLFKVVPIVLAPLWVVGAMPADRSLEFWRPRVLAGLLIRAALLVGLIVVGFLPFYLSDGARCLGFLDYHRARPLEIGSLLASVPLVLWLFGQPLTASYSYGSINVHSPLTPTLVALSPWLTAAVLGAATALLLVHFRRLSRVAVPGATLASAHPLPIVGYALLLLMLYIATGKVFSTQYLLWLAPLVALLPRSQGGRGLFAWGFLLVAVLSTILVPFLFLSDLIDPAVVPPPHPLPLAIKEPTTRLVALLLLRNLLFLGLVVVLALRLVRSAFQLATNEPEA
jgi:hypothetical protein